MRCPAADRQLLRRCQPGRLADHDRFSPTRGCGESHTVDHSFQCFDPQPVLHAPLAVLLDQTRETLGGEACPIGRDDQFQRLVPLARQHISPNLDPRFGARQTGRRGGKLLERRPVVLDLGIALARQLQLGRARTGTKHLDLRDAHRSVARRLDSAAEGERVRIDHRLMQEDRNFARRRPGPIGNDRSRRRARCGPRSRRSLARAGPTVGG